MEYDVNDRVHFVDLERAHEELRSELEPACLSTLASGRYILGPELESFEKEFAAYCGTKHCIGVSDGLQALHLMLRGLGIGANDEVLVPANTFIATWLAVTQTGAMPVAVDCDEYHQIDTVLAERAVTARTKAILAVHLYGHPADMGALSVLAKKKGILLLEDAAQAHGARMGGRRAGAMGKAAGFSFYPGKNLGAAGDGGAVTTDDDVLAERVKLLRNYGSTVKYKHEIVGFNARLDSLHAAMLRVKLRRLDEWNDRRRRAAARYVSALSSLPGLSLPRVRDGVEPVWHLFVVECDRRDDLSRHLSERGIDSIVHYPVPPHLQPAYAGVKADCPRAERAAKRVLSLPMHPHLTDRDVELVCKAVSEWARAQ